MLPPLKRRSLEQLPLNNDADKVCDWLCAFIKQTCKNNRGEYTPKKPIPAGRWTSVQDTNEEREVGCL